MIIASEIAGILRELGIRRVYGLPGEDHMAVLDAFAEAGLEYFTAYNESAAVIMAATDSQLTGLPGVAILSLAPGVSNGLNGLLNTYLEQVPLILLSGQHAATQYPFTVRQGFDIEALVTPMTKWRARLTAGMDVCAVLGKAVDEAMSGRPGPIYLELPDAVATAPSSCPPGAAARTVRRLRERWVPGVAADTATLAPSPGAVSELAERLAAARRPILVLGGRRGRVSPRTAAAFAAAYRIPVFTTSRRKGELHDGCDHFAGVFLNGRLERGLFERSDLVLLVDPEAFDFYNRPWCFEADSIALTDETFSEWLNPIGRRYVVDPEDTLAALTARCGSTGGGASQWTTAEIADYRAGVRTSLLGGDHAQLTVAGAVDAALAAWPRDGYLVADAGFSKPLISMLSQPVLPDRFLASNALSTMGYSIPAAIAARRAGAGPVLAFLGDGSLLMRGTELAALEPGGPPLVVVAIMDRALTQIEVKQERRELRNVGVTLPRFSCAAFAEVCGIDGLDLSDAGELSTAVAKGLSSDRPLLIGAQVDPAPSRALFELLRG